MLELWNLPPAGLCRSRQAPPRLLLLTVLGIFLWSCLTSCGVASRTRSLFGGDLKMAVKVSADLNQNAPVAVDLVVVYEKSLLQQLQELGAQEWFRQRDQLQRDFPKGFDVWSWEWVPGQEVEDQVLSFRLGAAGALIFADYFEPGAHRQAVDPHEHFRLELGTSSFSTTPLKRN